MRWFWLFLTIVIVSGFGYTTNSAPHTIQEPFPDYGTTTRVNLAADGTEANWWGGLSTLSADGHFVAFETIAWNLVPGDTNNQMDVFVVDRVTHAIERVSVNGNGNEGNSYSRNAAISADGRYVVFQSNASNLVAGDTNEVEDIFVHDRQTGTIVLVSRPGGDGVANGGSKDPAISADGQLIAFTTSATNLVAGDTNEVDDVVLAQWASGTIEPISSAGGIFANRESNNGALSADGRYVLFVTEATNLGGGTNQYDHLYLRDRITGTTTWLTKTDGNVPANGDSRGPKISADGRYALFNTSATNLVANDTNGHYDALVLDRTTGQFERVSVTSDGGEINSDSYGAAISSDGRYVFFSAYGIGVTPWDTNSHSDAFRHDRQTGEVRLFSMSTEGVISNDHMGSTAASANGQVALMSGLASNLVMGDTNGFDDIFVHEFSPTLPPLPTPTLTPTATGSPTPTATPTPSSTVTPRIPPYPNELFLPLVAHQTRWSEANFFINLTKDANGPSYAPVTSHDGGVVAFTSAATNLVADDTNNATDIFVWERSANQITRVSVTANGTQLAGNSERPSISGDGRYIVYTAWADGGIPQDTNGKADIYRYDRQTGEVQLVSVRTDGGIGDGDSIHADVSADGNIVVFVSNAHNLNIGGAPGVPGRKFLGFVRHLATNQTTLLRYNGTGNIFQDAAWPSISDDGTAIALAVGYTQGYCTGQAIARIDVATGATGTIAGTSANHHWEWLPNAPRISPDGTQVGYRFYSSGESGENGYFLIVGGVNIYTLTHLPLPGKSCGYFSGNTQEMSFSASGQQVAFTSADLTMPHVPGDQNGVNDVFLWDTTTQEAAWISKPADGLPNGHSYDPYISGDGRTIIFTSEASNLVRVDNNGVADIFVWVAD